MSISACSQAGEVVVGEEEVSRNQYSARAHESLIHELRLGGSMEPVRRACIEYSYSLPMKPGMRLQWIRDEMDAFDKANGHQKMAHRKVIEKVVLRPAIDDMVCIDIASVVLEFAAKLVREASHDILWFIHTGFEIGYKFGLSFRQGAEVWEMFRLELEQLGASEETRALVKNAQATSPVRSNALLGDYFTGCMLQLELHEKALVRAGSAPGPWFKACGRDLMKEFDRYIETEPTMNMYFRASLWERCISECSLCPEAWLGYSKFLNHVPDFEYFCVIRTRFHVLMRAVRFIPNNTTIWNELVQAASVWGGGSCVREVVQYMFSRSMDFLMFSPHDAGKLQLLYTLRDYGSFEIGSYYDEFKFTSVHKYAKFYIIPYQLAVALMRPSEELVVGPTNRPRYHEDLTKARSLFISEFNESQTSRMSYTLKPSFRGFI